MFAEGQGWGEGTARGGEGGYKDGCPALCLHSGGGYMGLHTKPDVVELNTHVHMYISEYK